MANLNKQVRSSHSPSPIYGDGSLRMNPNSKGQGLLRPGFTVGDLDHQYATGILVYGSVSWAPAIPAGGVGAATTWGNTNQPILTQRSTSDLTGTIVKPGGRAVKIAINVTGTGTVDVSALTMADGTTSVFDGGVLPAGNYEFFVGGWASPVGDAVNGTYQATQYGPVKAGSSPAANDPTGGQETGANKNPSASSNYVGGTYNPVLFLSLDGFDLKFFATVVGTVGFDVEVTPIS